MKFPRFSLASIGFAILVLGIDFAVIRIAFRDLSFTGWAAFAFLLLPMCDTLMIALYRMRQPVRRSTRAIGFFIAGTVATIVVFVCCLLSPETALGLLGAIGRPIALASANGLTRLIGNAAMQSWGTQLTLAVAFELVFPIAFFCLPPLLVALLGCWVVPRLGRLRRIGSLSPRGSEEGRGIFHSGPESDKAYPIWQDDLADRRGPSSAANLGRV
jgi:hypothetical protein